VLDFSWALVGSITTKTLGDLGADVIKVESRTRPCLSRIDVQVSASKPASFDDKPWFAHLNTSKRSLSLDMKKPEAMEVLGPLIEWADVVVENFSPGTMAKLGLDYAALSKRNPALVMVSGSVYGQTGPLAQEWGVDGTGAALSGRTYLTGWPDRDPVIPGSVPYGDVIVPFVMAASVSAALAQREQSGRGVHIDAAMYEICVQQMHDAIISAQQGKPPQRQGNDDAAWYRQGVWPTAGNDRWIAISVRDEAQWQQLCAMAGGGDLAAWTATQQDYALMDALQAAGIAAGVLQDIEDLFERDAGLRSRGALVELPHPALGAFGHVRTPVTFSRSALQPYRAPALGEHNVEVATVVAGLDESRVAALKALEVFQ
jgi:crotonobetainyl-CoA:carnitine CoA-transferase CaiB-like acyl-CoA transferase